MLNNETILYIDNACVRHSRLRDSLNTVPACSSRAQHTQFKDKPDMIEVDTTYLWQMSRGVDAKGLCASIPASLSQTQSEFGSACANEMRASKQADTARLRLTLRRPVVSQQARVSSFFPLTNCFPSPASGALRRALISGQRTASTTFLPTWVSPSSCRLFFVSGNTPLPQDSL